MYLCSFTVPQKVRIPPINSWLDDSTQVIFQFVPKVFYWVKIGRFWGSMPEIDANFIIKPLSCTAMLRIIVLHESMWIRSWKLYLKEGQKCLSKNLTENGTSIITSKIQMPVGPPLLIPVQTCTLFNRMFKSWLRVWFFSCFPAAVLQSIWMLDSLLQIRLSK